MGKRLENICEALMELFQKNKRIEEEQVHTFFEGAVDYLEETDEVKTVKLDKLASYMQKKWQYREIEGMTSEQAFLCGSIWGGIKLLGMKRERKEKVVRFEELKKQYSGHYDFLHAIAVEPGIKHKDLAEKCGKSPSQLSQFVTGVKRDGLITWSRIGREKYYYLRPLGTRVHEELKREKQKKQEMLIRQGEEMWRRKLCQQWGMREVFNASYEERYIAKADVLQIVMRNSNNYLPDRAARITVEDNYGSAVKV